MLAILPGSSGRPGRVFRALRFIMKQLVPAHGPAAEVLRVRDQPSRARTGEVLVRVHASGVNPTDYKAARG